MRSSIGCSFFSRPVAVSARRGFVSRPRRAFLHSFPVAPISPDPGNQILSKPKSVRLHVPKMTLETERDAPEFRA